MLWRWLLVTLVVSGSAGHEEEAENPLLELARGFLEESLSQEGGGGAAAGLLGAMLDGGQGGGGKAGEKLLWKLGESVLGAAMGAGGHKHSEDPDKEDSVGHAKHEHGTQMLLDWLHALWQQVPREWAAPLQDTFDLFTGPEGKLRPHLLFDSLENPSFRKRWIRTLSGFVAHWIKHLSQPHIQTMYLQTAHFAFNELLLSQGYVEREQLLPGRPFEESLSKVIDQVLLRQFGVPVNSATYIKPAVRYVNDLMKMGQGSVSHLSAREIDDKLAETINGDILESVLRVWRAHKHAVQAPQCDRYLICELNRPEHFKHTNSTIKPGITKLASLVSSWFLSGYTGTSFFDLYNAAVENYDCKVKFPVDCSAFHEEDIRITTEYAHNEL